MVLSKTTGEALHHSYHQKCYQSYMNKKALEKLKPLEQEASTRLQRDRRTSGIFIE